MNNTTAPTLPPRDKEDLTRLDRIAILCDIDSQLERLNASRESFPELIDIVRGRLQSVIRYEAYLLFVESEHRRENIRKRMHERQEATDVNF